MGALGPCLGALLRIRPIKTPIWRKRNAVVGKPTIVSFPDTSHSGGRTLFRPSAEKRFRYLLLTMDGDGVHLLSCSVDPSHGGGDRLAILREHQGGDLYQFPRLHACRGERFCVESGGAPRICVRGDPF